MKTPQQLAEDNVKTAQIVMSKYYSIVQEIKKIDKSVDDEDILQELMTRIFKMSIKYDPQKSKECTFFTMVATHSLLNILRNKRTHNTLSLAEKPEEIDFETFIDNCSLEQNSSGRNKKQDDIRIDIEIIKGKSKSFEEIMEIGKELYAIDYSGGNRRQANCRATSLRDRLKKRIGMFKYELAEKGLELEDVIDFSLSSFHA